MADVYSCIRVVKAGLLHDAAAAGVEGARADSVVAFNQRPTASGGTKFSFHVVFPGHGFLGPFQLKAWLKAQLDGLELPWDEKVYSRHQLMRVPWSGKGGNADAILLPITFAKVDSKWTFEVSHDTFDAAMFRNFNINFFNYEKNDVMMHEFNLETKTRGVRASTIAHVPSTPLPVITPLDQHSMDMLAFFQPLLPVLRKSIQEHRKSVCELVQAGGVPTETTFSPPVLRPCNGDDSRVGIFHYTIANDSFCEYDHPNFHHSTGTKTTIQLNLVKGTYNQLCFACKPTGCQIRYYSLFELDCIVVRLFRPGVSPLFLELSKDGLASMFVKYFHADLIFNPLLCSTVIVYDESTKLWVYSDRTKGNILLRKKNEMKTKYINYITARYLATMTARKRVADKKEKVRIVKEGKELSKVPAFADVAKFTELVTANMHHSNNSVETLDPYPNLVAMADGQCFDVFTGTLQPSQKYHYFTSCLNAVYKQPHDDEEDHKFIKDWFLEISRSRPELSLYLQQLKGLLLTYLKLDRKFYANLAPVGSNGKSTMRKMLKTVCTDPTGVGQNRFTNLNNKFFCLQANNSVASGAPRPDWIKMLHRTLYLVEELPAVKLDVEILKLIGSREDYEARLLYNNIIAEIEIRGRLLINTNHCPDLGDTKPVWNRAVLIPYDTTYVEDKKEVDESKHRFLMNEQFLDTLLTKKDAFASVCLLALHRYLRPYVKNGKLEVSELHRPACVTAFTESHRSKFMSVSIFMNRYARPVVEGETFTTVAQAHTAFRRFLKDKGMADMDYMAFLSKLQTYSFPTKMMHNEDVLVEHCLTGEGYELALSSAPKGSIEHGFFQQANKRRNGVRLPPVDLDAQIEDQPHIYDQNCITNPNACDGNHCNPEILNL